MKKKIRKLHIVSLVVQTKSTHIVDRLHQGAKPWLLSRCFSGLWEAKMFLDTRRALLGEALSSYWMACVGEGRFLSL